MDPEGEAGRLDRAPEKLQVDIGFLKHSGTDPLKKQLDPRVIFQGIRTIIAKRTTKTFKYTQHANSYISKEAHNHFKVSASMKLFYRGWVSI